MRKLNCLFLLGALLLFSPIGAQEVSYPLGQLPYDNPFAFGQDMSFVLQAEQRGRVFSDTDGTQKSPWQIFRDHGWNWARLMICNEPSRLGQGLDYVLAGAKKLREYGYHFALDFMMSDGWSNPMTQPTPASLKDLSHAQRVQAWHDYVLQVISALKAQGTPPEIVQVGNEIGNGAFWPDGRIYYGAEKRDQSHWKEFTDYLTAGCRAIREVEPAIRIMLHVDFGGDLEMSDIFFGKMAEYGVDYDVIGFSFYPWSHGTLMDLRDNLYYTIRKYRKPVYVIETGYYSVPSNYFERKGIRGPVPETPQGQKEWMQAVAEVVMAAPDHLGRGVFWWEPMSRGRGFFDDATGIAKPIMGAFDKYALPSVRPDGNPRIWDFEEGERP